ncbi:hypothetical protein LEP1GSC021_4612 [Leptospira noguchii str. 1993005606]|uniref:WG repeat-containing protein n=1 Tax=Leptospira noguchii str. 2007001578 TaxID=1049974 RepID=A0ABN0J1P7_9LEPT|nr:hypothetical protein LEP1GSC035_1383 [Leptospira noguchii str. 2007001578]EPE84872.1 hypothetical protein LEP1GSC021_4612 [Leptospira noguchii str. 1993005606]
MNRPIIRLWGMENIGLIIEYQTGIIYSNQTGGYACLQPEVEGFLVPLEDLENKIQQSLQGILRDQNGEVGVMMRKQRIL